MHGRTRSPAPASRGRARLVLVLALLALAAVFAAPALRDLLLARQAEPRAITPRGDLAAGEQSTIAIFEQVSPSVVFITTHGRVVDWWTRKVTEVPRGTGSGFVWDERGHVVTNWHVLEGAERATVRLADQRSFDAVLVGASPDHDLAVLRIAVGLDPPPPVAVGASADLRVGQTVLAIGNPFGLDHTLTTGVISALDRSIDDGAGGEIEHLIQTDAAINPGNSGGPLIDSAGRLIGVNTAIFSPSGAYAGIGFAVPVDTVNRVVPRLIAEGRWVRPVIGIQADDRAAAPILERLGLDGVLVLRVAPGSPAERAGLEPTRVTAEGRIVPGDVIVAVDGEAVRDLGDLQDRFDARAVGDTVQLTVVRDGETRVVAVALAAPR